MKIPVALDWTPNGNHVGFYVAKAQGLYKDAGLDVELLSPSVDSYTKTPASRVETGEAMFAITPSETVVSFHTRHPEDPKPKIKAVATLLQKDNSAIAVLKSSGIERPSQLEGKRYASYSARYEGRIVQQMIKNDGGSGDYQELALPMLGVWNTLIKGEAEATWIFLGWEGVEAEKKGVELNTFKLEDYKIPYGYSPVLIAHPDTIATKADTVKSFLAATAQGYKYAAEHPEEAGQILYDVATAENPSLPTPLDADICKGSIKAIASDLLDGNGNWGVMSADRWNSFIDWLSDSGLLTTKVQSRQPKEGISTTLDALRAGDAGDKIPRESVNANELFTSSFLSA